MRHNSKTMHNAILTRPILQGSEPRYTLIYKKVTAGVQSGPVISL